jgi:hypothetical protein
VRNQVPELYAILRFWAGGARRFFASAGLAPTSLSPALMGDSVASGAQGFKKSFNRRPAADPFTGNFDLRGAWF